MLFTTLRVRLLELLRYCVCFRYIAKLNTSDTALAYQIASLPLDSATRAMAAYSHVYEGMYIICYMVITVLT